MDDSSVKNISINGVDYVRADAVVPKPIPGKRAVLVADRGWIFAGDVTREGGRILITRALHVFDWKQGGFSLCVSDPKKAQADLRPIADVDMPEACELFVVPVDDNWGMK